jgi:hypothetical protein
VDHNDIQAPVLQLYNFMVENRQLFPQEEQLIIGYLCPENFKKSYEPYLAILRQLKWIKFHPKPNLIILGECVIQQMLWGQSLEIEAQIEIYWKRYSTSEISILQALFSSFASLKKAKVFEGSNLLSELIYYNAFPIQAVLRAARTYLGLRPETQHGPNYYRGILRNERVQIPETSNLSLVQVRQEVIPLVASRQHSQQKEKMTWVAQRLTEFQNLNPQISDDALILYKQEMEAQFEEKLNGRS